jgi:ankyrin repeat protein
LQEAILVGSSETVKIILENSQVTEDENILRQSSLHLAVWRPQHLALLLQAGFDVNAWDWNERTPLMYAAATGMTEVAITLIRAGADIWAKDNLYSKHTWLPYAIVSTHWQLVLGVIDVVRQLPCFSKDSVQVLLDSTIGWWAMDILAPKDSAYFATLLEWGADPEFRFTAKLPGYKVPDCTLLHCITNVRDFDTLLRSGFKGFNHANGKGGHALMTQLEVGNPELIQKSINAGCQVDHQDFKGRTALHVCAEIIRATILSTDLRDCDLRFQILGCTEALLLNGADPFLGDCCLCACSESGCTPAQILLKDFHHKRGDTAHRSYPLTMHSWVSQWLQLLKGAETDFEHSRRFFHDAIRLSRFEQLELTHTCCRFVDHGDRLWIDMDEEDVEGIRDEERELIDLLESSMSAVQSCSISELESLWRKEMDKLMELQGNNFVWAGNPLINLSHYM